MFDDKQLLYARYRETGSFEMMVILYDKENPDNTDRKIKVSGLVPGDIFRIPPEEHEDPLRRRLETHWLVVIGGAWGSVFDDKRLLYASPVDPEKYKMTFDQKDVEIEKI